MPKQSVAVIGASSQDNKFGNKAVRAYLKQGFTVFPVNPHEEVIEGLPVFKRIQDIPGSVDRVTLYVPPEVGVTLLEDIRLKNPSEVWINPGAESQEIFDRAQALGLNTIYACSILDIGEMPHNF